MYVALLVYAPFLLAQTNADPIFAALKVFAFRAGGVGGSLGVTAITLADILHHGHKRLAAIGVNGIHQKVGVDHDRLAERVLSVALLVISVPQLKGLAVSGYDLVEIAFFMRLFRKRISVLR